MPFFENNYDKLQQENINLKKLTNLSSKIESEILISQLRASGIQAFPVYPDTGDYQNILGMGSVMGTDIYVAAEDYDRAKEIIDDYKFVDEAGTGKVAMVRRVSAIIMLIVVVIMFLVSVFSGM